MYRRILLVSVLAILGALLIACGGDDDDDASSAQPTTAAEEDGSEAPSGGAESLAVGMIDFGYEPASLTATAGNELTIDLTNNGDLPHTFTIDGLVDSMEVAAGESATISFTPAEAGTLTFFCTIHGAATMSGELTVN